MKTLMTKKTKNRMTKLVSTAGAVAFLVLLAACGSDEPDTQQTAAPGGSSSNFVGSQSLEGNWVGDFCEGGYKRLIRFQGGTYSEGYRQYQDWNCQGSFSDVQLQQMGTYQIQNPGQNRYPYNNYSNPNQNWNQNILTVYHGTYTFLFTNGNNTVDFYPYTYQGNGVCNGDMCGAGGQRFHRQ